MPAMRPVPLSLAGAGYARTPCRAVRPLTSGLRDVRRGGLSDLLWHTIFGIERNIAAVVSPSHLLPVDRYTVARPGANPLRRVAAVRGSPAGRSRRAL
jgi:hypothetical protein